MSPNDAPSVIAMKRVGQVFQEYDSDSSVMIVLEGDKPLGDDAHEFYDEMVRKLDADTTHVQHVQDFWGDPLTAAGAQSTDGKAAYVQVYLAGNQGEALANESVEAVRDIVASAQPPPGVKAYVTGPAATSSRPEHRRRREHEDDHGVTFGVIILMLLLVYRSIVTTSCSPSSWCGRAGCRRAAWSPSWAIYDIIGLSTFAINLLVMLAIAAATDYAIFLIGRYQEAREASARTGNRPTTRCSTARRTSSWARA